MRVCNAIWAICGFVLVLAGHGQRQPEPRFVVMPKKAIPSWFGPSYRDQPFQGIWQPTNEEVARLEADLPKLSIPHGRFFPTGVWIDHPERFYRQYYPLLYDGKKMIWISAICEAGHPVMWKQETFAGLRDGPLECQWSAWYDPEARDFIDPLAKW